MTRVIGKILEDTNNLLESNQTTTSNHQKSIENHNTLIRRLTFWIVLLTIVIGVTGVVTVGIQLYSIYNGEAGRYAISGANQNAVYILDTKTGEIWVRSTHYITYLGTNESPKREKIRIKIETNEKFDPIAEGAMPLE